MSNKVYCAKCRRYFEGDTCPSCSASTIIKEEIVKLPDHVCCIDGCTFPANVTPWVFYPPHVIPSLTTKGKRYCDRHYYIENSKEQKHLTIKKPQEYRDKFMAAMGTPIEASEFNFIEPIYDEI